MSTGRLRAVDGRWEIVFSPWLAHSPERVWHSLTEPESLRAWFPNEMHGDRAEGARLRFTFPGKGDEGAFDGEMRTWDPPRVFAFRWGDDELHFELQPEEGGARLTLVDTVDDVSRAARDAAGWHACLDRLQVHLDGQDPDFVPDERREQLHPVYVQEFEGHGAATGPLAASQAGSEAGTAREPVSSRPLNIETAAVTPWWEARSRLVTAQMYGLATVRRDGRPHLSPLSGLWTDGLLYLCTSASSVEADNLAHDPRCAVTVSALSVPPLHLVVEGEASMVSDHARLGRVAEAYAAKYGHHMTVQDGALHRAHVAGADATAQTVFAVPPTTVSGFPGPAGIGAMGEGAPGAFSSTQWKFTP